MGWPPSSWDLPVDGMSSHHPNTPGAVGTVHKLPKTSLGYFTSSSLLDSCALVFSDGRKGEGQDKPSPGACCGSPHYNHSPASPIHLLESLLFSLEICLFLAVISPLPTFSCQALSVPVSTPLVPCSIPVFLGAGGPPQPTSSGGAHQPPITAC